MASLIRDAGLAGLGNAKMDWVTEHMPILARIRERFQKERPFAEQRIAISLHLEAKTAALAELLAIGGALVRITSSNPLSTQDDVAAALSQRGVEVFAWHGETDQEFDTMHHRVLEFHPTLLIDDGGELTARLHGTFRHFGDQVVAGAEETTTGITRLKALDKQHGLSYPMFLVNDASMKHLFDNRYGTGQSTWDAIMRTTNLVVAGKTVVIAGYGWCGKGVAERARGLGAVVIVTEVNPIRANEAVMDGFRVMPMQQAASVGDIFITVTGNRDVIRNEHFSQMKSGAILANAGHFDVEVDVKGLARAAVATVAGRTPAVTGYRLADGRVIWVLAEGRLVNLAAGDGHPTEIMDLTFALQALCLEYGLTHRPEVGLYPVPDSVDQWVANIRLQACGIAIDTLTPEQQRYLDSW